MTTASAGHSKWTCHVCTYDHEAEEAEYLRCAMCTTERRRDRDGNGAASVNNLGQSKQTKNRKRKRPSHATTPPSSRARSSLLLNNVLRRLPSHPAQINGRGIPDDEVQMHCPAIFKRKVLPEPLATRLLRRLEDSERSTRWGPPISWTVFDKTHVVPRTSATYQLDSDDPTDKNDIYENGNRNLSAFTELMEAGKEIEKQVHSMLPSSSWKPTFCLANRYEDGNETVGMHSDFLNPLGPRPIIVGLSLGSTRTFRLQQQNEQDGSTNATTTTVNIPMPHNSLIVMLGDCQERWQHGVPRLANSSIVSHSEVGKVRISLTFRMSRPDMKGRHKKCYCGVEAKLKASSRGRYYYSCSPSASNEDGKSKQQRCDFYEPCEWAEQEACAMRETEYSRHKAS